MNTFGEQIEFYTGVKDYQSPLDKSKTTNMPKILSKLGMLSKTKSVGEYPEKIELLKKFLRDPQVFALFLVSLMTKKSDQLAALHSLANELMFKNSLESHVFEHGFLTNHEVLDVVAGALVVNLVLKLGLFLRVFGPEDLLVLEYVATDARVGRKLRELL